MAPTRSQARAHRDFVDDDSDFSETSSEEELPIFENLTKSDLKSKGSRITWRYATKTKLVLHAIKYRYSSKSMPSLPVAVDLMHLLEIPVHKGVAVANACVEKVFTLINNVLSNKGTGGLIEEQCVGRLGRSSLYTVRFHGALWAIAEEPEAFDYRYMLAGSWISQKKAAFAARKATGVEDWLLIAEGNMPNDQMGTKKVFISKIANTLVNSTKLTLPAELPSPLVNTPIDPAHSQSAADTPLINTAIDPAHSQSAANSPLMKTTIDPAHSQSAANAPQYTTPQPIQSPAYDQCWYNLWYHSRYYLPYMLKQLECGTPISAKVWKRLFPTYPTVEYVEDFDYVKWAAELPQQKAAQQG